VTDPASELVDVVDEDDVVVRVVTRAEMRRDRLRHRCVFVVVRSADGAVLTHRRSPHKDLLPSWWDLAAGGVVASGEDYDAAARRELAEELGVTGHELRSFGAVRFDDERFQLVGWVYEVVCDGPFVFSDGEVSEVRWVGLDDLRAVVTNDSDWMPDSVAVVLPLLR
jgi:8-oxo-dGTP pyrophosphatase MutT (NUDIX family)